MRKYLVDYRNNGTEDFIGVNARSIEGAIRTVKEHYGDDVYKVSVRDENGKETVIWEK